MKKLFKKLLSTKKNLYVIQKLFKKTLEKKYPCLVTVDVETMSQMLLEELEYLLSSTLKFKTGRIVIRATVLGSEKVIMTRKPGLKHPYAQYRAFDLTDVKLINRLGNLVLSFQEKDSSAKIVFLGDLRKNKEQIDQEKLKVFYEFLDEAIDWISESLKLINHRRYHLSLKEVYLPVGKNRIKIYSKHFQYGIKNDNAGKYGTDWDDIDSDNLTNFNLYFSEAIQNQKELMVVSKDFDRFQKELEQAEIKKVEIMDNAAFLIKKIKDFNKPFRLLNELLK